MEPPSENATMLESKALRESYSGNIPPEIANTAEWMQRTYRKLHRIALSQMSHEYNGHTLSATSLIHEVFLRLQTRDASTWPNERHFLAIAAMEMKRVLIDAARRKQSVRRGGQYAKQSLKDVEVPEQLAESVIELNEAIDGLAKVAPKKAELVQLRYLLGLSEAEAAETLGISRATAARHWTFARAWLLDFLSN